MAETVTSMATGVVRTAITGDFVPLAQAALTVISTRATGQKSRLAVAGAGAVLQAITGNVPGAMITFAASGAHEAASSQTTRDAINATSLTTLLVLATGTSVPAAALFAVVHFGISYASNLTTTDPTPSAKAPPAPATPEKESWLQWGKRMLGCDSRRAAPSPA